MTPVPMVSRLVEVAVAPRTDHANGLWPCFDVQGPALVAGEMGDVWIYVFGPAVGALIAVLGSLVIYDPAEEGGASREAAQGEGA